MTDVVESTDVTVLEPMDVMTAIEQKKRALEVYNDAEQHLMYVLVTSEQEIMKARIEWCVAMQDYGRFLTDDEFRAFKEERQNAYEELHKELSSSTWQKYNQIASGILNNKLTVEQAVQLGVRQSINLVSAKPKLTTEEKRIKEEVEVLGLPQDVVEAIHKEHPKANAKVHDGSLDILRGTFQEKSPEYDVALRVLKHKPDEKQQEALAYQVVTDYVQVAAAREQVEDETGAPYDTVVPVEPEPVSPLTPTQESNIRSKVKTAKAVFSGLSDEALEQALELFCTLVREAVRKDRNAKKAA